MSISISILSIVQRGPAIQLTSYSSFAIIVCVVVVLENVSCEAIVVAMLLLILARLCLCGGSGPN
jgi:hypothetical protein